MKKLSILALVAMLFLFATGCASIATLLQNPITVTDDFGREVTLPKTAVRLISLAPSTTEMLFALGLGDKVFGVTDFCNYPEAAQTKEKVGGFGTPSIEKIVSLNPDLVIATNLHEAVVRQLEQLQIPVVALHPRNIEQIADNALLLGKLTGATRAAEAFRDDLRATLRQVEEKTNTLSANDRPLVYFEIWHDPIISAGPNTIIHELITRAGGVNIAARAPTDWPTLSLEDILAQKPAVIFRGHGMQTVEEIRQRPNWETVPAMQTNRIYLLNEDIVLRPGPRIVQGLLEIAKVLHPELWP